MSWSRRTSVLMLGGVALLLLAVLTWGRGAPAWWARRAAQRLLDEGAVSRAQAWLAWSSRFAPRDGRADVIRASCYRHQRQAARFQKSLRLAAENGASSELIERESKLAEFQSGNLSKDSETELVTLIEAGVSAGNAYSAFVYGCLYRGEPQRAQRLLEVWKEDFPNDATVAYMEGIYWRSSGDSALAHRSLEVAIERQPRHELARTALAEILEEEGRYEQALAQRVDLASRNPFNEAATLNLVKLLRKTGRASDARTVAEQRVSSVDRSSEALWELGEIALDMGEYDKAQRHFQEARLSGPDGYRSALTSAASMALKGDADRAEALLATVTSYAMATSLETDAYEAGKIFQQLNAVYDQFQRSGALRARLAVNPNDVSAARQFMALSSSPFVPPVREPLGVKTDSGPDLYARHCAACHGDNGDGNGRAARHLYPRPKNLRSSNFRLIRTLNGAPSRQDMEATIRRGMPGTSMPPFEELSPPQLTLLAEEVLSYRRAGIRDQLARWMTEEAEEIDEEEIRETVEELTTPGELARLPSIGPSTPEAIDRGNKVYNRMGCVHCHGDDGRGPSDTLLVDDEGRLTSSRDLACEPLKGGDEPQAVYLRVLLGMPGTPHPACTGLKENEMTDLVHFCLSLKQEPCRNMTNHDRLIRATRPASGLLISESAY